jgi:hypothetical protein
MIRSCVDAETREVVLPEGFAERIARTGRRRRLRLSVGLTVLVTVTTVTVVAAVVVPLRSSGGDVAPEPALATAAPRVTASAGTRPLAERVRVTWLPPGAEVLEAQARTRLRHMRVREGHALWVRAYRIPEGGSVWVWVFSGDLTARSLLAEYRVVDRSVRTRWAETSRGRALVGRSREAAEDAVVMEAGPGLVLVVTSRGLGRVGTVRIAEGVRVE